MFPLSCLVLCGEGIAQESSVWNQYQPMLRQSFKYENETDVHFYFQDAQGFLWGSDGEGKLIRFDGHEIRRFRHDPQDSTSFSGCRFWVNTTEFLQDKTGKIWIMSPQHCLDRYDPATDRFESLTKRIREKYGDEFLEKFLDIYEDRKGDVWIGTPTLLLKHETASGALTAFKVSGYFRQIFEDDNGNLWIGGEYGAGNHFLERLDMVSGDFKDRIYFTTPPEPIYGWNRDDQAARLPDGRFLLLVSGSLLIFNAQDKSVSPLPSPSAQGTPVSTLYAKDSTIFLGTFGDHLFRFLPSTLSFQLNPNTKEPGDNFSYLSSIFQSREGILWANNVDAVHKILPKTAPLHIAPVPAETPGALARIQYAETLFTFGGEAYFGTVPQISPVRKTNRHLPLLDVSIPGLKNQQEVVRQFEEDSNGNLWIAACWRETEYSNFFLRQFNPEGKVVKEFSCTTQSPDCFAAAVYKNSKLPAFFHLIHFIEDREGGLWLGTGSLLSRFDIGTEQFQHNLFGWNDTSRIAGGVNCLMVDSKNQLWVGSSKAGLNKLDQRTGEWTAYPFGDPVNNKSGNAINTIFEDSKGNIWVGTEAGVMRLGGSPGSYRTYTEQDLLPDLVIKKIFEDHHKNLWVTAGSSLARYDSKSDRFIPFAGNDAPYFNQRVYRDRDNYIYLTTHSNVVAFFHPDSFIVDKKVPPVIFTDFLLANHLVRPGDSTAILQKSLDFTESVTLQYAQNDFTIRYTAPVLIHPNETVFAIRLEGFNDDWQEVGTKREARYTNLSPGTYTFKVKVRNHHGFWSETPRTLKITILPPWHRTWWAYLFWATIIAGSVYWVYRFKLNRRLAEAEALRLKELDLAKSRLYTNITHEFRTPLTVILGMEEQVRKDPGKWFSEGMKLIRRNGKQLLHLVNQMLDLSKLESGNMPLHLIQGDVIAFLKYLTESFHSYADSKDIRLHFLTDLQELQMDYDPEKLQHIVSNLLSNAIKFTPAGGDVYFHTGMRDEGRGMKSGMRDEGRGMKSGLRDEGRGLKTSGASSLIPHPSSLILQVLDNGIGIAPEHLPHIFDRFYQADDTHTRRGEGTGIGLALTKELVRALGGDIEVESEEGKGTRFTLRLPVTRTAEMAEPVDTAADYSPLAATVRVEDEKTQPGINVPPGDRHLVLLIEDNPDVTTYLASFLSGEYRIITAANGQEGIEKAFGHIPDLVVSDVMMPEMDGFEVCRTLKTDERTSHIPVILLTAKADMTSKIEGLKHGADAYLAKPFNKEELLVRLEKLIELRRELQERYGRNDIFLKNVISQPLSLDEIFLQKVIGIVEANLADEDFGMHELCRAVHMSRSHLFRKLKALTGKSTTVFIRSIRLGKARELLETTGLNVSEVAYGVGFSNPKYFSRVFQEEFGIPPSEVRNQSG